MFSAPVSAHGKRFINSVKVSDNQIFAEIVQERDGCGVVSAQTVNAALQ